MFGCNREDFAIASDGDFGLIELVELLFTGIAAKRTTDLLCSASGGNLLVALAAAAEKIVTHGNSPHNVLNEMCSDEVSILARESPQRKEKAPDRSQEPE